jgi:hypothetical protein
MPVARLSRRLRPALHIGAVVTAAAWLGTAACARHHASTIDMVAGDTCAMVSGPLSSYTHVDSLGGRYHLRMVATQGGMTSRSVDGELVLRPRGDAAARPPGTRMAYTGTASIQLESVGAVRLGDPASSSDETPGVGAYVTRDSLNLTLTGLLMRVGSTMNAGGPPVFDAAFTVFYVQRVRSNDIWGTWRSASGVGLGTTQAEGYFCAMRQS